MYNLVSFCDGDGHCMREFDDFDEALSYAAEVVNLADIYPITNVSVVLKGQPVDDIVVTNEGRCVEFYCDCHRYIKIVHPYE